MRGLLKHDKVNVFYAVLLGTVLLISPCLFAQQLSVVKKSKPYSRKLQTDSSFLMVELKALMPNLVYDLRYFTDSNFTHTRLYEQNQVTFLRLPVAKALKKVQA